MKLPKIKMSLPLTLATGIYLLFSLLGCLLYLTLPPVLCSVGARIHAYLLIEEAVRDQHTVMQIALVVFAQLGVLFMAVMGILAIVKGPSKLYVLMVALDIGLTFLFLLFQRAYKFNDTLGIVFNIAYFVWLLRQFTSGKPAAAPARKRPSQKQKGK